MQQGAQSFVRRWVEAQALLPRRAGVSRQVQLFLTDVILEALDLRGNEQEWKSFGILPSRELSVGEVEKALLASNLGSILGSILQEAEDLTLNRKEPQILLIDVIQVVNRRWCGIWPFCRAEVPS